MEHLNFTFDGGQPASGSASSIVVGVVSSGNLEVMVEPCANSACSIEVNTSARGFDHVWAAVLGDFFERSKMAGVRISINDAGATPAVVGLRLDQALEEFRGARA